MLIRTLQRLLFPRGLYCVLCEKELFNDNPYVCPTCLDKASWVSHERPLSGLNGLYIAGYYEEIQRDTIHRFKYRNHRYLADYLASQMIPLEADPDAVLIPVPSHPHRKRSRGYCQTEDLARALQQQSKRPLDRHALRRTRDTPSQTTLNAAARHANVSGAFQANRKRVQNQHCLLIEDVVSTGATLQACSVALINAGAKSVCAWVLASGDCPEQLPSIEKNK